jgi:hypothetical protein
VRCWLLELIGEARSPQALPVLVEQLNGDDEALRSWAVRSLEQLDTNRPATTCIRHGPTAWSPDGRHSLPRNHWLYEPGIASIEQPRIEQEAAGIPEQPWAAVAEPGRRRLRYTIQPERLEAAAQAMSAAAARWNARLRSIKRIAETAHKKNQT